MTYLWIALGGALGSVGRAWLAVIVARLTGPFFPWGTILINVLGSFVIGFFGTLTATGARFPVPIDARAFVMIGICGGFTTFSSFSLQTLDLARDGRPWQALANVGLSLVLCLASVAGGHYGAAALQPGVTVRDSRIAPGAVLAVLDRAGTAPTVLAAAERLVGLGLGGRVQALVLRAVPATSFLPSEEVLTAERLAETEAVAGGPDPIRTAFEAWSRRDADRGDANWAEVEGPPGEIIAERGRQAEAIVIGKPAGPDAALAHEALHAALFATDRPVLLMPSTAIGFGRVVAVAWQDDGRTERAARAALPCLRQAGRVVVLRAGGGALPRLFAANGVRATLVAVPGNEPVGPALLNAAGAQGADLLVMGAWAHAPWQQALFGGVTRHVLAETTLPVLLRH